MSASTIKKHFLLISIARLQNFLHSCQYVYFSQDKCLQLLLRRMAVIFDIYLERNLFLDEKIEEHTVVAAGAEAGEVQRAQGHVPLCSEFCCNKIEVCLLSLSHLF